MAWWMAIPAVIGAVAGGISVLQNSQQEERTLRKQRETAWEQYELGQGQSDAQYSIQRSEARFQADLAQQRLREGVAMSVDQMNTSLLAQAFGIQDARIQSASNIGASRAAEGASGTRGNAANELVRAYAAGGLERNIDIQNRQNDQALRDLTTRAANSLADIAHERDSWDPGGYRYQSKEAQDIHNRDIADLGQSNFNWQIDQASPTFLDYATGVFGGGSSGMSMANSMYEFKNAWFDLGKKGGPAEPLGIFNNYMPDYSNQLGINSNTFLKNWGNML